MKNFIIRDDRLTEKERRNLSILDAIRKGKQISRADISKNIDLNIVTVSNYISRYIKKQLVFETGLDISTGGRRPELLRLNEKYAYTIGIDLGSQDFTADTNIVAVLLDITGKVICKEKIKKEKESFDKLSDKVLNITELLIRKSGISTSDIKGIGVGVWGIIDRYRSMIRYNTEEEQIINYANLLDRLETTFGVSVLVEHDAMLAAFGEKWSGMGITNDVENFIFLCADSSCGIIIKNELYFGSTKNAGEMNLNPPINDNSDKCWEDYKFGCCLRSKGIDLGLLKNFKDYINNNSTEDIKSLVLSKVAGDMKNINFDCINELVESGDEFSIKILKEAGEYLGVKIAFLVNFLNPEIVIIGRGIEKLHNVFFSALRKSIRKWAYEESVKVVKIVPTSLEEDVVAVGAAALVMQKFFTKI